VAVLLAILVVAFVPGSFSPSFRPEPVLHVLFKIADISRSLAVSVLAFSMRFVVEKLAFIDIATCVVESALALCYSKIPFTVILRTVTPRHRSPAMSQIAFPLA
jgi:hypothetical protein